MQTFILDPFQTTVAIHFAIIPQITVSFCKQGRWDWQTQSPRSFLEGKDSHRQTQHTAPVVFNVEMSHTLATSRPLLY